MQEVDVSKICVDSLIIWCEVNVSIFDPSKLVLSLMHHLCDFVLKPPNTNAKNWLKLVALCKFNPRFL